LPGNCWELSGAVTFFTQQEFDNALTIAKAEIMTVAIQTTKQAIMIQRQACAEVVSSLANEEDEGEVATALKNAAEAIPEPYSKPTNLRRTLIDRPTPSAVLGTRCDGMACIQIAPKPLTVSQLMQTGRKRSISNVCAKKKKTAKVKEFVCTLGETPVKWGYERI
jgi:uncharacterized protein YyaL (SSP411 family)